MGKAPRPRKLPQRKPSRRLPHRQQKKKPAAAAAPELAASTPPQQSSEDEETRSSPLVRKIAREHGVSLSQISGTGLGGRITKQDIMAFIERAPSAAAAPATPAQQPAAAAPPPAAPA